jgi:hypothetical protein
MGMIQEIHQIYLLQVITPNYLKSIAYNGMLIYKKPSNEIESVMCIMKFKKILD